MKMKKFLALSTASVMALSMAACGSTDNGGAAESTTANTTAATAEASTEAGTAAAEVTGLNYADITLGEDYTDITTTIKVLTNRTDLLEDGAAVPYQTYIDAFNEMYPNITVDVEGITDYASDTLLRLQGGDYGREQRCVLLRFRRCGAREHGRDDPPALFRGRAADGWHPTSGGCTACAAGVGGRGRLKRQSRQ